MNKLQVFCAALDGGFLTAKSLELELCGLDRLFPLLVRCGCGRFTCAVQDLPHFTRCVNAGGDYVRDVSLPIGWEARAASWVECCPVTACAMLPASFVAPRPPAAKPYVDAWTRAGRASHDRHFAESDCGGVFDGHGVISDADPGL